MTNEEKTLLESFLSKAFNLDTGVVADIFNEAGELTNIEPILSVHAERVSKNREVAENQYKRGVKESLTALEKQLKNNYIVDSDKTGLDLINDIIQLEAKKVIAKTELQTYDFEKDPKYLEKRKELEKQLNQKEKELTERFENEKKTLLNSFHFEKVKNKAFEFINENKYILPFETERKRKMLDIFANELNKSYNFIVSNDSEDFVITDKDGQPAQDQYGKLLNITDVYTTIANTLFDKQTANERSNAGVVNTTNTYVLNNREDYRKAMQEAGSDLSKQAEISLIWEGKNKK